MDLSAEVEMDTTLSLPSPDRFSASYQGWEARATVLSAPIEAHTLQLSDSEDSSSPLISSRLWESRLTQLKVTLLGGLRP